MALKKFLRPFVGRITVLSATILLGLLVFAMAALSRLVAFLSLFGGPHSGIRITQEAAARAHHNGSDARLQVVPRIIHQIFHDWKNPGNEKLPSDWEDVRQTCLSLNPGWDYKVLSCHDPFVLG